MKEERESNGNPVIVLGRDGRAIWLDFISRRFVAEGGLKKLADEDGLSGVTSNPSIFKKAIGDSSDYDAAIHALVDERDCDVMKLYEQLAIADIQNAADVLRPVYKQSERADGFVSLEVSPYIARDTAATVAEARRLWKAVDRENVMIKVPATEEGIPAIRTLLGEGINVNITLLFSRSAYRQVAEAYLDGLELYVAAGGRPDPLSSVATFFVRPLAPPLDKFIAQHLNKPPTSPATHP